MEVKTLRQVCELVGITRRVVQGYEKAGLVFSIGKNKYGHLLYDLNEIERIRMIRKYQEFGFSVKEIKFMLEAPQDIFEKMLKEKLANMRAELHNLENNIIAMESLLLTRK